MSFFAGIAEIGASTAEHIETARLGRIGFLHGGASDPSIWRGEGVALVHVQRNFTPQDRFDRLPCSFAGGCSRLVFDGRFDNRSDLLSALGIAGDVGARTGDAALLCAALGRWGTDACRRLVGAFSFAWWDATARTLVLAVDSTGGRALFAHVSPGRICFATRPTAVLAFPGVEWAVDQGAMAHLLLGRLMPAAMTPFSGLFRLPPAGCLVWKDGRHTVDRYWRPDPTRRIHFRHRQDYVDAGREMLDRVVGAQMRSISPIACHLSGGLDSSAVAATAARLSSPSIVHTLTATPDPNLPLPPDNPRVFYNEMPLAAATAQRHPNIVPHFLPASGVTSGERAPWRLFTDVGFPMRNFMSYGAWQPLYAKARELDAAVVFNGYSGNFTLSWRSEALLADLLASGNLVELARQLRGLRSLGYRPMAHLRSQLPFLVPAGVRHAWSHFRGSNEQWRRRSPASDRLVRAVDLRRITDRVLIPTSVPDRDRRRRIEYLERSWATGQWMAAAPYISGCDLRDPLGDRRMVEFCLALPMEIWQCRGEPRSFAREVLSDRLPPIVARKQARGYQNADWFYRLDALRPEFMAELALLESSPIAREMLDLRRIRAVAESWPADVTEAMARSSDMLDVFARGIHYGRFMRWVEAGGTIT